MAIVTAVVVLVFGTLTLMLHDETFIKMKPTIVYTLFAAILGGGLLFDRSFIAIMFDQMFNLTPHGWRILTVRWALWFFAMAVLNEIIWRTQSTDFWVSFKVFGMVPLTMLFAMTQMPLIKRYQLEPAIAGGERGGSGGCVQGLNWIPICDAFLLRRTGLHVRIDKRFNAHAPAWERRCVLAAGVRRSALLLGDDLVLDLVVGRLRDDASSAPARPCPCRGGPR